MLLCTNEGEHCGNMVICTICMGCMGRKQRPSTDLQILLVRGKRFQFCLLQNFELPLQYIKKLKFFWDLEILKL